MKRFLSILIVILTVGIVVGACSPKSSESQMRELIEESNKECPTSIDHLTTLKEIKIDGDFVTYVCEIDETQLDMDTMLSRRAIYKQNISNTVGSQITNPESASYQFFQLVMESGKGLRHHYAGRRSGKFLDIDITNDQLQQLAHPQNK